MKKKIKTLKPNSNNLTKFERHIATAVYPTYGGFSTWDEVRKAKKKAKGSYWHEGDWAQWVAFTPKGKRIFYDYDYEWKSEVKECAILVAQGKVKEANRLYNSFWDGCCFKNKDTDDETLKALRNAFR